MPKREKKDLRGMLRATLVIGPSSELAGDTDRSPLKRLY
jgi:hypothetical protein